MRLGSIPLVSLDCDTPNEGWQGDNYVVPAGYDLIITDFYASTYANSSPEMKIFKNGDSTHWLQMSTGHTSFTSGLLLKAGETIYCQSTISGSRSYQVMTGYLVRQ